jgi:pantoate kinase
MKIARAFAPANISLIFKILAHKNPAHMGSLGVGFTVNKGVIVSVKKAQKTEVLFNKKLIDLPTVLSVVKALTSKHLNISITSTLPLGSGFGISGASALASALAINKLLGLNKSRLELAKIAHKAEVENKTGLGDVASQYFGGFLVKFVSSAQFTVKKLPITSIPIYCKSYGPLLTSSVLSNSSLIKKINKEADVAHEKIKRLLTNSSLISFSDITSIANTFTKNTGLRTPEVTAQIQAIKRKNGNASMILLGNAIVSDIPFTGAVRLSTDSKKATLL